ncbi:DUF1798 family protein [Bacillus sp. FJAT-47783]|uniref:DUF1798 family protein n=1 Tax=Bacillus sp. FJAT-47783 TaxID=2922712 RepID=UPI001FABC369|nr:DUF1798 family protein [Bacillus sp. FJAT-47783]
MNEEQIVQQTTWLLMKVKDCESRFLKTKASKCEYSFHDQVKPYCDEVFGVLDEWSEGVTRWIDEYRPKYIVQAQIENCKEQLEQLTVQSFFHQSSFKRFKDMKESVQFILESIIQRIK